MNIIKPDTNIDFVGTRHIAGGISLLLVIVSIALFVVKGPNWGIDFTGGTEIHLDFTEQVDIAEVRGALSAIAASDQASSGGEIAVQQIGADGDYEFIVRIQDPEFGTKGVKDDIKLALEKTFGATWIDELAFDAQVGSRLTVSYTGSPTPIPDIQAAVGHIDGANVQSALDDNTIYVRLPGLSAQIEDTLRSEIARDFEVLKVDSVGPKVGGELRRQGFSALVFTLALVMIYIAVRFELAFAPGAVLALIHDVVVVTGIFVITGHEFNLPMVGALLTIIGYSLNDTIVIYDRIRENMRRYRRRDTASLINASINETLGRTLATSITTGLAMTAFLVLGGPVIETFALAILLGVIFGTYSTIFVASPTILIMEDMRPHLERIFSPVAARKKAEEEAAGASTAAGARREERRARRDAPVDVPDAG
jgi:preprotein translocase subunit SecF